MVNKVMYAKLMPVEIDILNLIKQGKKRKQVAKELYLGLSTVGWHMDNIMMKLEADNAIQAVVNAIKKGVISV